MYNAADGGGRDIASPEQMREPEHGAACRIIRGGTFLPNNGSTIARVQNNQVSEGAADINTKRERRGHIFNPMEREDCGVERRQSPRISLACTTRRQASRSRLMRSSNTAPLSLSSSNPHSTNVRAV
jgi:hypothetical protein